MEMRRELPKVITLTERAADRAKTLLAGRDTPAIGLRVGVRNAGCSDLSYTMDFADEHKGEEVVEDKGVKILIDPKAVLYLIGSQMDWVEEKLSSRFVFNNPNETGRCGCGESFTVDHSRKA